MRDFDFKDPTWSITNTDLWSGIESTLGIVCACAPLLGSVLPHASHLIKVMVSSHRASLNRKSRRQSSGAQLIKGYEDTYPLAVPKTSTIINSRAPTEGSGIYEGLEHGQHLGRFQVGRDWQVHHA